MHRGRARARARRRRLRLTLESFAAGAALAAVIAALALRAHALTRGGAAAAFAVGALTYAAGGWAFTLVLLAFFVPSVALSRVGRARKKKLVDIGKAGGRDASQVLANGGVATGCAVIAAILQSIVARDLGPGGGTLSVMFHPFVRIGSFDPFVNVQIDPGRWIAAFGGAYAAATADTWGTEIGTLARGKPRSILTRRPIATGLSGGITIAGTAAEAAGALWLGVASAAALLLLDRAPQAAWTFVQTAPRFVLPIAAGGIAGALADSLLGATLQELRWCSRCKRGCETDPHVCGTATERIRGIAGFSNDAVNAAATLTGAIVAFALAART